MYNNICYTLYTTGHRRPVSRRTPEAARRNTAVRQGCQRSSSSVKSSQRSSTPSSAIQSASAAGSAAGGPAPRPEFAASRRSGASRAARWANCALRASWKVASTRICAGAAASNEANAARARSNRCGLSALTLASNASGGLPACDATEARHWRSRSRRGSEGTWLARSTTNGSASPSAALPAKAPTPRAPAPPHLSCLRCSRASALSQWPRRAQARMAATCATKSSSASRVAFVYLLSYDYCMFMRSSFFIPKHEAKRQTYCCLFGIKGGLRLAAGCAQTPWTGGAAEGTSFGRLYLSNAASLIRPHLLCFSSSQGPPSFAKFRRV